MSALGRRQCLAVFQGQYESGLHRLGWRQILASRCLLALLPAVNPAPRPPLPPPPLPAACSYRQMAGRAGRAGIDTLGECILINQEIPLTAGERLFTSGATPVQSCLVEGKRGEPVGWLAG